MAANLNREQTTTAARIMAEHVGEPMTLTNGEPYGEPAMDRVLRFGHGETGDAVYVIDVFGVSRALEPPPCK